MHCCVTCSVLELPSSWSTLVRFHTEKNTNTESAVRHLFQFNSQAPKVKYNEIDWMKARKVSLTKRFGRLFGSQNVFKSSSLSIIVNIVQARSSICADHPFLSRHFKVQVFMSLRMKCFQFSRCSVAASSTATQVQVLRCRLQATFPPDPASSSTTYYPSPEGCV